MPTTGQRGYGGDHQKLRKQWAVKVDAGVVYCARCHRWIAPSGQPCYRCFKATKKGGNAIKGLCGWDLGHDDFDRSRHVGPEHACCNRSAARAKRSRIKRINPNRWMR